LSGEKAVVRSEEPAYVVSMIVQPEQMVPLPALLLHQSANRTVLTIPIDLEDSSLEKFFSLEVYPSYWNLGHSQR
jgi:hypothetical protein